MRWFGDGPVQFTNWENSSASDLVPLDTCVTLHSNTGKWENVSCLEDVENGVVCETGQSKMDSSLCNMWITHNNFFFSSNENFCFNVTSDNMDGIDICIFPLDSKDLKQSKSPNEPFFAVPLLIPL